MVSCIRQWSQLQAWQSVLKKDFGRNCVHYLWVKPTPLKIYQMGFICLLCSGAETWLFLAGVDILTTKIHLCNHNNCTSRLFQVWPKPVYASAQPFYQLRINSGLVLVSRRDWCTIDLFYSFLTPFSFLFICMNPTFRVWLHLLLDRVYKAAIGIFCVLPDISYDLLV